MTTGAFYSDWPSCLPRYRWMIDEAVRFDDPERIFNVNRSATDRPWDVLCKVCGVGCWRKEIRGHLDEHVGELRLSAQDLAKKYERTLPYEGGDDLDERSSDAGDEELYGEVRSTIEDVVEGWYADEDVESSLGFDLSQKKLSDALASAIVVYVEAQDELNPPLCHDCQD